MIAAFLILRLRSVLGRHRDSGRSEGGFGTKQRLPQQEDAPVLKPERSDDSSPKEKDDTEVEPALTEESLLEKGFAEIVTASPEFKSKEFLL